MADPNVVGDWHVFQSTGHQLIFDIETQDSDGKITGEARLGGTERELRAGKFVGNQISLRVDWNSNSKGQYNGTLGLDGRLSGVTFDLEHPQSVASWWAFKE